MPRGDPSADAVHVALLRGINVGGKHRLSMKDLAAMVEAAGGRDVRTYVQSGNVVFRAGGKRASGIAAAVARAVLARLGFAAPVLVRTAAELRAVARGNPFLRAGADPEALHVLFLAHRPPKARVAALDPKRSPPDEFAVRGREIYLRLWNGVARTKLGNAYFDAQLGTTTTMRNWRTVLALLAMTEAP